MRIIKTLKDIELLKEKSQISISPGLAGFDGYLCSIACIPVFSLQLRI
ncbi:hypothetical protein [Clostridium sp.]